MIAYNIGDSYTTPDVTDAKVTDHYWYKLAMNDLSCQSVINNSKPGRSNDLIVKIAMQHCLENLDLDVFYIINVTTIFRFDINVNKPYHSFKDLLTNRALNDLDFETIECNTYSILIGLIEFLKSRNKQFLIINNSKQFSDDLLPMRDAFVDYFKKEPRILNWFSNARENFHEFQTKIKPYDYKEYGWHGHDGIKGHSAYYEMLKNKLPK